MALKVKVKVNMFLFSNIFRLHVNNRPAVLPWFKDILV